MVAGLILCVSCVLIVFIVIVVRGRQIGAESGSRAQTKEHIKARKSIYLNRFPRDSNLRSPLFVLEE